MQTNPAQAATDYILALRLLEQAADEPVNMERLINAACDLDDLTVDILQTVAV